MSASPRNPPGARVLWRGKGFKPTKDSAEIRIKQALHWKLGTVLRPCQVVEIAKKMGWIRADGS